MWHTKKLPLLIDLAFGLILLPIMITLLPIERWLEHDSIFVYMLIIWLYIVYFTNRYLMMPLLISDKKKIHLAVTILLLSILITWLITQYQMDIPMRHPRRAMRMPRIKLEQQAVWFLYVVVMAFGSAVGLLTELYRQITKRQTVEFEKKKAELALYKAQINPHFLFNNLNTLYGMVITGSSRTEEAFSSFIGLMQYMYTNNNQEKIPVHTEIEYIRQYIQLQKYRMPATCRINFSYRHDETDQLSIVPMILITFVENVFKHGISSTTVTDLYITIIAENREVLLSTINPIIKKDNDTTATGIGIENCKKRLELLYPDKHTINIEIKNGFYNVTLNINVSK